MNQFRAVGLLSMLVVFIVSEASVVAAPVSLNAVNRGSFRSDGRHFTGGYNTFTGYASSNSRRYHSFFVFDLDALEGTVDSASLQLELELFAGPFSTLTFDLFDVSATAAELDATYSTLPDAAGIAIHTDLGSGNVYATQTVSAADVGNILNIPLSALAQTTIESQLNGTFAVGVSVQGANSGDYNLRFGEDLVTVLAQLDLELTPLPMESSSNPVPEPCSQLLLLSLLSLFCYRVRPKQR